MRSCFRGFYTAFRELFREEQQALTLADPGYVAFAEGSPTGAGPHSGLDWYHSGVGQGSPEAGTPDPERWM